MKTISLNEAYQLLEKAIGVILDKNGKIVYPSLSQLTDDDEHEFLYLSWDDRMGYEYDVRFKQGNNSQVNLSEYSMFLTDIDGQQIELSILGNIRLI